MNGPADRFDFCVCFTENPSARALAERLIKEVSSYDLPRKVRNPGETVSYKNGCIMPFSLDAYLTHEQQRLLLNSKWLMIICDRQSRNSRAINQAISLFISNRGREYILPVLTEGEPQDSFPPEFFEERLTKVTFSDGTCHTIKEIIEPLAIDVRANSIKSSLSLLRHVQIKIVAALIGVSYDTLEQRHEKRARRRLRIIASVIISVPLILGAIFTYLWLNSERRIDIAIKKTQVSKDLLDNMCQNYPLLFKDIPEAGPYVNALLVESLEKLRVAESEFIPLLEVDELLKPDHADDLTQVKNKAKILRYLGRKQEASEAYRLAALKMDSGGQAFEEASILFVEKTDPLDYPCGILVQSIDAEFSKACDGLCKGDIIVKTEGFKFRDQGQFQIHFYEKLPQHKKAKVTILRPHAGDFAELVLTMKPQDSVFEYEEM